MNRGGERFREACNPAMAKIFFHLTDLNSERLIAENVPNPARKIAAARMTFQGRRWQPCLQGDEFFQGARTRCDLAAVAGENKRMFGRQWDLKIFRAMP